MKIKSSLVMLLAISFATIIVLSSCNNDDISQSIIHISPTMCETMFQGAITPELFCANKGANTFLENKYAQAEIDKDGCLILTLDSNVITEWKNTFLCLHVLQCVLEDSCNIGVTIDYSMDFMYLMEDAHTCGYEISDDFTKIIESPEDNGWYFPHITLACAIMQIFEGKTCSEVKGEHIEIDENGEVIEKFIFPDDSYNLTNDIE